MFRFACNGELDMKFAWGKVIERFSYDFDGTTMDVVKFHPWKTKGCQVLTGNHDETVIHYHCSELNESTFDLMGLLIYWIARKKLGTNQYALVDGVCRALGIHAER